MLSVKGNTQAVLKAMISRVGKYWNIGFLNFNKAGYFW
jgi:hypothetical protein